MITINGIIIIRGHKSKFSVGLLNFNIRIRVIRIIIIIATTIRQEPMSTNFLVNLLRRNRIIRVRNIVKLSINQFNMRVLL